MTGPKPTSPKRPKRQDSEANALREFLESVGSYMLVPYYSVNDLTNGSFRLPIKRIVVGPSPHKDINMSSVRAILAA
jgi:hypothetical protein